MVQLGRDFVKIVDVDKFAGTYKLTRSENFDEFKKALNVGFMLRKLGNTLKNTVVITANSNKVTIKTISTFKTTEQMFTLEEEAEETTIDGRKMKTRTRFEEGKLVQNQKATKSGEKDVDIVRELISESEMVVTMIAHNPPGEPIIAKRFYERE